MSPKVQSATHLSAIGQASQTRADRRFSVFGNLMLALAMVGYPLSASVSQIIEADSNSINIAYRATILALSFVLGIWSVVRAQYRLDGLILVFLTIYTIRMLSDLAYSGLPDIETDFQFYLATTLLPVIALGGGSWWYDERTLARLIAFIGTCGGLLITYNLVFNPDETLIEALGGRAAFRFLNPISIGYHGLYIAIAALIMVVKPDEKRNSVAWLAVIAFGIYLMVAGGSRGPLLALLFAVGFTGLANTRASGVYVALGLILTGAALAFGAPELVIGRFQTIGEDASSLERYRAIALSFHWAITHPMLGYAYIEPATGNYPHNLLVEAGMALGVFGALLMLAMQISLLMSAWRLARNGEWLIPFLGAVLFANAWISGAIWGAGLFFGILWVARGRAALMRPNATQNSALKHSDRVGSTAYAGR